MSIMFATELAMLAGCRWGIGGRCRRWLGRVCLEWGYTMWAEKERRGTDCRRKTWSWSWSWSSSQLGVGVACAAAVPCPRGAEVLHINFYSAMTSTTTHRHDAHCALYTVTPHSLTHHGMPPLPARRNSLCLLCAFAARSPPQALRLRLRPHIQTADRSTTGSTPGGQVLKRNGVFNPLKATNPFRPARKKGGGGGDIGPQVRTQLEILRRQLSAPEFLESLQLTPEEFDQVWMTFERSINIWIKEANDELKTLATEASRGKKTLQTRMRYLFYARAVGGRFTTAELENQKEVADLRYPVEWYPATRQIPRTVHLHVGPTNSGKTYHALKRLEEAETGIYLGPLRLLAHEVYTRLNAKGKSCALVTGEEQRMPESGGAKMFSCTVEMAPLNTVFDVAVVDEIQMINHPERGWAWTQAFLGLQAREIHLCGEARTVSLMRELCALVGDKVHVHEYERLTPLMVEPRSLGGKLRNLQKGDCIVAFTVLGIHALRREIEKKTGKKCAIVYGSLPPETRAQQARLFNDPTNEYDYLVASDAIGMGLNLCVHCRQIHPPLLTSIGPSSESSSNRPSRATASATCRSRSPR